MLEHLTSQVRLWLWASWLKSSRPHSIQQILLCRGLLIRKFNGKQMKIPIHFQNLHWSLDSRVWVWRANPFFGGFESRIVFWFGKIAKCADHQGWFKIQIKSNWIDFFLWASPSPAKRTHLLMVPFRFHSFVFHLILSERSKQPSPLTRFSSVSEVVLKSELLLLSFDLVLTFLKSDCEIESSFVRPFQSNVMIDDSFFAWEAAEIHLISTSNFCF